MAHVKPDPDRPYVKQEYIKQDPDNKETALADIDEEDLYEDAGDLDFTSANQSVWLSRLPKQLWEHWAHLNDDDEIEIGTMRVEGPPEDIKRVSRYCTCSTVKTNVTSFVRSVCAYTIDPITKMCQKTTCFRNKSLILRELDRIILIIPSYLPRKTSRVWRIAWPHSAKHDRFSTNHRSAKLSAENRASDGSLMSAKRYPVRSSPGTRVCICLHGYRTYCTRRCCQ